jgi:hypothetical protein
MEFEKVSAHKLVILAMFSNYEARTFAIATVDALNQHDVSTSTH